MAQTLLVTDIEAAKEAIRVAEDELRSLVGNIAVAPRASKVRVSDVVRTALLKLSAAKEKLDDLEKSAPLSEIEAARTAIDEAWKHLNGVLGETVFEPGADTTMVTEVIQDAFAKLKIAKTTLADLEAGATDDD